jgi:acyl-CoA synthetase (AMP-forming)/AMP-acid ligase II
MSLLAPGADGRRLALVDGASGQRLTWAELRDRVARAADALRADGAALVGLVNAQDVSTAVTWLAAFEARRPALWLDPAEGRAGFERLLAAYRPPLVLLGRGDDAPVVSGYVEAPWPDARAWRALEPDLSPAQADLGALLSTSGSTGSPRVVRLSRAALATNAAAIVAALGLRADDTALLSLPLAHAFGLSVLDSHLLAGGAVVLTRAGLMQAEFWRLARAERVTCLPGVPFSFELLAVLGPERTLPDGVRLLIQAGGRLRVDRARAFRDLMRARGGSLRVMYGQTEATARISVWPAHVDDARLASVGRVIPGGALRADPATGELLFRGPSVMLGYAASRADLARPAEVDELRTGDLGRLDADGFVFLEGRLKRIAKISGRRLDLDDVEALVPGFPAAAVDLDGRLRVCVERAPAAALDDLTRALGATLGLDAGLIEVRAVEILPRTSTGKIAYAALARDQAC